MEMASRRNGVSTVLRMIGAVSSTLQSFFLTVSSFHHLVIIPEDLMSNTLEEKVNRKVSVGYRSVRSAECGGLLHSSKFFNLSLAFNYFDI